MLASGAMAWTASTSSVSSPYQPLGSHCALAVVKLPGMVLGELPGCVRPSPWFAAYWFASFAIVGDA